MKIIQCPPPKGPDLNRHGNAQLYIWVQGSAAGDTEIMPIETLNEASAAYRAFIQSETPWISQRDAGTCFILHGTKTVAVVTYNGCVFELPRTKNEKPIYTP